MTRRGQLRQLGTILYRLYVTAYMMVVSFALLGDLSGDHAQPLSISNRTTAWAGATLVLVVAAATGLGRVAVALRPSPAEVQLALLSPVDRSTTLARPISLTATASIFAGGGLAVVLMLVASPQFAGLSVGIQLTYVAFAAGVGLVTYGGHLLVAEQHRLPTALAGLVLIGLSLFDVVNASAYSPATAALRAARGVAPFPAMLSALVVGVVLTWRASVGAESIELEKVSRGGDLADSANIALAGNDIRTLLILQRSMGVRPWRTRPLFEVAPWFVRRFPVLSRSLRGVARWRIYRWLFVIAMTAAASGLLRVQPASVRTTALAGVALWLLGLAVCESFAQEHDRADRLAGLPMALGVELRQIGSCWLLLVAMLLPACAIALAGRSNLTTVIALAAASASGATAGACNSLRRVWKSFDVRYANNPALVAGPFVGGDIALTLAWPVLLVILCIAPWARQSHGVGLLLSSVVVFGGFVFWIKTGGIHAFGHRLFPRLVSPPQ